MYKDKEAQKEANRVASQKRRDRQKGMTPEGMTEQGMTRIEFIQKELHDTYLVKDIESSAKLFNDRDIRYERAYRYKMWRDGTPVEGVDSGTMAKLSMINDSLKGRSLIDLDNTYYGTTTFKQIDRVLNPK